MKFVEDIDISYQEFILKVVRLQNLQQELVIRVKILLKEGSADRIVNDVY